MVLCLGRLIHLILSFFFFFNDTATTEIYTLSLHDALPIYLAFLGMPMLPATLTALYTLLIAFLMVSRLPVFSGKTVRMRVPPEMVLPVFVSVVFFVALLIGYPWHMLSAGSLIYLLSLPA